MSLKASIIGASGYAGVELVRLLARHPNVEIRAVSAFQQAGKEISTVFPHLRGLVEMTLQKPLSPELTNDVDFIFLALPGGASTPLLPAIVESGARVIDLGGDLRLPAETYETWYGKSPADAKLQSEAVYGLSELFPEQIRAARLITNPGCYPTAAALALAPLVRSRWIETESIIIDAKSGVTGAGRGTSLATHFNEVNENFRPYKVGNHQHIPEIEQCLSTVAAESIRVHFTPHLLPVNRGILASIYVRPRAHLNNETLSSTESLHRFYKEFYAECPFVRICEPGTFPGIKEVQGTNYSDIGLSVDTRSGLINIFAAIDNLVKGAAGQAVQNMNLMAGLEETAGLDLMPLYP